MAATPTPVQNKMAALVDVETKMTSPIGEKRCERPCLLFTKQPVDLWSPGGGGTSGWSPTSSEEPDSGHSTWQRIVMAEEDEPRFTVAQLISAFNKHQALVTKTSLEVTMNIRGGAPESKILPDEVSNHTTNQKFPIGPEALRLFIPGIKISDNNKSSKTISPTTPPPDNMTTKSVANPTNKETDVEQTNNREKTKKVENTSKKPTNPSSPTRVDCNADFSPPTPPPPPPALSSEQTRNYKTSDVRTTRHRTSGRQATTLAASNKIRKKSNTTAKPPPFY